MQSLLISLVLIMLSGGVSADSTVNSLQSATMPLSSDPTSAMYVDQGGTDTQLRGDFATGLGLNTSGANTIRGNFTNSTGNDTTNAMPSCPDSGTNHLNYTSGTGISCGTAGSLTALATVFVNPADPTGVANSTTLMQGLGASFHITPALTGNVHIAVDGTIQDSTASQTTTAQIYQGTGSAPANQAAVTGSTCGNTTQSNTSAAAGIDSFSLDCYVTGLTPGVAVWIDIGLSSNGTGTASIKKLNLYAEER